MEENATKYVYNTVILKDHSDVIKGLKRLNRRVTRQNTRLAFVAIALTTCVVLNQLEIKELKKMQRELKELITTEGE